MLWTIFIWFKTRYFRLCQKGKSAEVPCFESNEDHAKHCFKSEWTLTSALNMVMIFLKILSFYTVVWSCRLKSKRKQGKIGTGGCRVRSQGRISINFTASATQPNETHRSCSPSDSAVPEQPSEQIANTDCPFRILARHLVCHRTICSMNFCSVIWVVFSWNL